MNNLMIKGLAAAYSAQGTTACNEVAPACNLLTEYFTTTYISKRLES